MYELAGYLRREYMISNPKNGWCDFILGDFHGTPSYLTNVPIDLLNCFKEYLYSGTGICWFDEEGTEFTLVITPYSLFIIEEKDKPVLHDFSDMNIKKLALEAVTDVEFNIDKWWSEFNTSSIHSDEAAKKSYKFLLEDLIGLIKEKCK